MTKIAATVTDVEIAVTVIMIMGDMISVDMITRICDANTVAKEATIAIMENASRTLISKNSIYLMVGRIHMVI